MLVKTRGKWDAAYDLLNLLLKDTEKYCNMCGQKWIGKPCCDSMQVGTNYDHLMAVVQQNKTKIANNKNAVGVGRENKMRYAMSMPPVLYNEWCMAFEQLYGEKLFKNAKDLHECMRKMPFLKVCETV